MEHIVRKGTKPLLLTICCPISLSRRQTILSNRTLQNLRIQRHRGLINQRQTRDCNTDGCHRVSQNQVLSQWDNPISMCQQGHQGHQSHQGHQNYQEGHKVIKVSRCSPKTHCWLSVSTNVFASHHCIGGALVWVYIAPLFSPPFCHLMIE